MKKFDLNIETILENWHVYHAIREFIANAMDEQMLTNSKPIKIFKENDVWHIRDFGRGIKYTHLTQNENEEKLMNPHVIGKFGIGLKDALATLDRHKVLVEIKSKYGVITIEKSTKQGFDDLYTLHALITPCTDTDFVGTDISLLGLEDKSIELAKKLFLKFSGEEVLETTKYGQAIKKANEVGVIYINGVKVAEEENFLFSYNITAVSSLIKKAINRERSNVGRSAYSESVKKILLCCESQEIAELLKDDMLRMDDGDHHDELKWLDIQEHAVKILNSNKNVLFVNTQQLIDSPDLIDEAIESGLQIINISSSLANKLQNQIDINGDTINDIHNFIEERSANFEYDFVSYDDLSTSEKFVYNHTDKILGFSNTKLRSIEVKIANALQRTSDFMSAKGVYVNGTIIIKRSELSSVRSYSEVLIHEAIHAKTGYGDVTRQFESALSETIGHLCDLLVKKSDVQNNEETTNNKAEVFQKIPQNDSMPVFDKDKHEYIYKKLQIELADNYLKKIIYYSVVNPTIPKELHENYNTIFESYEQYIDMRESIQWIANIPNTVNNLVLLYSLPLKTEEEYDAIKEFETIIPYSGYVYLYEQQADSMGIEIDRNALYNKLTFNIDTKSGSIMPLQEKLKAIFEAYIAVSEKYKLFENEYLKSR